MLFCFMGQQVLERACLLRDLHNLYCARHPCQMGMRVATAMLADGFCNVTIQIFGALDQKFLRKTYLSETRKQTRELRRREKRTQSLPKRRQKKLKLIKY